jgi:hypothetical protein
MNKKLQTSLDTIFSNVEKIFKMDLSWYRESFNQVVGYSFIDNKGNFSKNKNNFS